MVQMIAPIWCNMAKCLREVKRESVSDIGSQSLPKWNKLKERKESVHDIWMRYYLQTQNTSKDADSPCVEAETDK